MIDMLPFEQALWKWFLGHRSMTVFTAYGSHSELTGQFREHMKTCTVDLLESENPKSRMFDERMGTDAPGCRVEQVGTNTFRCACGAWSNKWEDHKEYGGYRHFELGIDDDIDPTEMMFEVIRIGLVSIGLVEGEHEQKSEGP